MSNPEEGEPRQAAEPQAAPHDVDFQHTYERLAGAPLRVERIMLVGLQRTKSGVVEQELARIKDARTLEEIRDAALRAYEELMALDIFDAVDVVLGEGSKGGKTCTVVARFQEKNMVRLHAGTYVQGTEGSMDTSLNLTNPLGYAEQVSLGAEYGSQSTSIYRVGLTKPKAFGRPLLADVRLHQLAHNFSRWSSYAELLRGGALTLSSEDGAHAVSYELGWRRLTDPARTASRAVVGQLGDKLLSAVKYVHRVDKFDDPAFPTQGYGLRSETQLAGLAPDTNVLRFAKQHLMAKAAFPISASAALTLSAEGGLLLPWGAGARQAPTSISDRFFLGGLGGGALRGFDQKGVGPSEPRRGPGEATDSSSSAAGSSTAAGSSSSTAAGSSSSSTAAGSSSEQAPSPRPSPRPGQARDALGGDLFCSLMAAINFKLPSESLRAAGVHGHVFVNGGNLVALNGSGRGWPMAWHEFTTSFRWSVGAGIVWPTRIGKLELNACQVLTKQPFDKALVGLQFGFVPPAF